MGAWKELQLKYDARGFIGSDKCVCRGCIGDRYLQDIIKNEGESGRCSFCGNYRKVMPMENFMDYVMTAAQRYYMDADGNIPYTREDGYLDKIFDPYDFIYEELSSYLYEDEPEAENTDLLDEMHRMVNCKEWASTFAFSRRPSEELMDKWAEYCSLIKEWDNYSVEQIISLCVRKDAPESLKRINNLLTEVLNVAQKMNCYSYIQPYHNIYRCVGLEKGYVLPGTNYIPATRIGTAPAFRIADDNRFSERGDMMFYGAENKAIAQAEVDIKLDEVPTLGTFHTNKRIKILNLAKISEWSKKSFFDIDHWEQRENWIFLRRYCEEISKQIANMEGQNPEYRPTEIFTKFIQRQTGLYGLSYWSSKSDHSRYTKGAIQDICYVLFVENRDCIDECERIYKINTDRLQLIMSRVEQ